jgi:hypothetical protein
MKPKNGQKKKATNTGQRELVATQDATAIPEKQEAGHGW